MYSPLVKMNAFYTDCFIVKSQTTAATATTSLLSFRRSHAGNKNASSSSSSSSSSHSVHKVNAKAIVRTSKNNNKQRRTLTIVNVATPSKKSSEPPKEPKRSAVEIIKENSDFLRHPLIEQLATPETFISEDAAQLYKFHGGY